MTKSLTFYTKDKFPELTQLKLEEEIKVFLF